MYTQEKFESSLIELVTLSKAMPPAALKPDGKVLTIYIADASSVTLTAQSAASTPSSSGLYIHTYIHTYTRTPIHTYIRTYIHTYIHTYRYIDGWAFPSTGGKAFDRLSH